MSDQNTATQPSTSVLSKLRAFLKSSLFAKSAIILVGTLIVFLICAAAITPARYQLSIGMVPPHTIAASRDVVDEITTEQNRVQAALAITPTYRYQEGITDQVLHQLEAVKAELDGVRQYAMTLPDYGPTRHYSAQELQEAGDMITLATFRDFQLITLMNASQNSFEELFASLTQAVRNTMQGHITQGQETIAISSIMQIIGYRTSVSLLQNVALPVLQAIIMPNMVIDEEATAQARQDARDAVEPVVYKQGQNILVRGTGRIKANELEMLNTLGLLSNNRVDYLPYLGTLGVVFLSLLAMMVAMRLLWPRLFNRMPSLILLYMVLILVCALCYFFKAIQLPYAAPLVLMPMLIVLLMGAIPALLATVSGAIIAAFMLGTGGTSPQEMYTLLTMFLLSGAAIITILGRRTLRSMIFVAGLVAAIVSFLTVTGIGLVATVDRSVLLERALWAGAGSMISALLCLAIQPLLETLFNLPTPNRLYDLSSPNHPLLRRLMLEAPGTYHHSVILANLAEAAAEAIGADALLARVGAYYHDIGKLKQPLWFRENQIGTSNIHDGADTKTSVSMITGHVTAGLALAKQYRLPYAIQQIISEHHGSTLVSYFYSKALKESSSDNVVVEADYRYPGQKPRTAESAIIMLCDTVEAAVRSMPSLAPHEVRRFIGDLIKGKVDDDQLSDSPLTLRDLDLIREACATVLHGVFHERVEYPAPPQHTSLRGQLMGALSGTYPAARRPRKQDDDTPTKQST